MNTICQNEVEYYFLLCRLQINLFCASGKLACYTTAVSVLLRERDFRKTKMVVEDEEVSRNLCSDLTQYVFFEEVDLEAIILGGKFGQGNWL